MRRIFKILAGVVTVLIGLPVLLVIAVLVLANTDYGRHQIETRLPPLTGGLVTLSGLSGRFPDALRIGRIELRDKDGVWLTIDDAALDWSPTRLVMLRADINQLAASRIDVPRLPVSSGAASSSSSLTSIPLRITLEKLDVARIDIGAPIAGAPASLSATGSAAIESLDQGNVTLALRRLDGVGTYDLTGRLDPARLTAQLTAHEPTGGFVTTLAGVPDLGALAVMAALDGPRDAVGTKLSVDAGPLKARADGTIDMIHEGGDLTVTASAPAMRPRPDVAWQSVALDAHVQGTLAKPNANGTLTIDGIEAGGAAVKQIAAQVKGDLGAVTLHAAATGIRIPGPKPDLLAAAPLVVDATMRTDAADRPVTFKLAHPLIAAEGQAQTAGPMKADVALTIPDLAPLAAAGGADVRGHSALHLTTAQHDASTDVTADGTVAITGGMAPLPGLIGDNATIGVTAALTGQDVVLSRLQVDGRTLSASAQGGLKSGVADLDWKVALADLAVLAPTVSGHLAANGHVVGPQDDFAATADLTGAVAAKGVPSGPLSAHLEAQHLPHAPDGKVTAAGTLDGAPLDLAVAANQDSAGALHVDISRASWKSAKASGDLTLPKGATLPVGTLDLAMTKLQDLRALTGQNVTGGITATVQTVDTSGRQQVKLRAEARDAGLAGTASVGRATLTADVTDPTGKPAVDAKLAVDGFAAGGMAGNATLGVVGPEDALALKLAATVQNLQGAPATLTSAATLNVPGQETTLSAAQLAWKGETLRLLGPARVKFGDEVSVDRLRLGLRQATVDIAGRVSPTLDLTAAIRNVTPDLARIVDPTIAADGTLTADARLIGTTARPSGTVRLAANGLHMRTGPGRALPPANLTANADLAGDSARIDSRLTAGRMTTVTVNGQAPLNTTGPLNLRTNGALDLALLDPLLSADGRRVRGQVALDATVTGTATAPRVAGTVRLTQGDVQDFALGAHLTDIDALLEANGDTVRITRFNARAGQGTMGLTGTVGVLAPRLPLDLTLTARNARPLASDRLTADLDADVTVRGEAAAQMQVGGKVTIDHAEIRIPERLPASVAVLNVRNAGAPPPPPPPPPPDIGLDLTLNAPREIFVRGRGLTAELGGNIHVTGTAANPVPSGSFELIRGTLSVAGQSLDFTKGEVGFGAGRLTDPSIDFVASSSTSSVTANLEVSGYASDPKITLSSTPELPQDEVLSYLIFKRSASALSPFEIAQIAAALASLTGVGGGIGDPLNSVRQSLGLDTLSVGGGTGNSGPTLQAGRYVAPGVFVGAKQGTSGTSTQGLVQVDIAKGLKLEGTVGTGANTNPGATPEESGGSSIGLKYQFEY